MAETLRLGPLVLERDAGAWRFSFSALSRSMPELPPHYDTDLAARLNELKRGQAEPNVVLELQDTPAINSRQLGVMISLQKALRPRLPRLPIAGASPAVRQVLAVTHTEQFFEMV